MRLFIAEKPSLGRAIADGLGGGVKGNGCITCGDDIVTWCFGHLLELCDPDEYDPALRFWHRDTLPILPTEWRLKPKKDAAAQLEIIRNLLQKAASVVNAGDPDREGQLLVDEVLEHCNYRGPVQRIWLASLDARSVAKALAGLTDNTARAPLRDAARARSWADWLVGLNATRAMSIVGREAGRDGVLSLGRVQTPTLGLVVTRDREIAAFKPVDYFVLQANLEHPEGVFTATFQPGETQAGLDSEGRLVDAAAAQAVADAVRGVPGTVTGVTREKKKKDAPLPHCLSSLQKAASSRWGMTAQQVLDTAQSLYEKKLTSYPRTDCRYLPVEQFGDAGRILEALSGAPGLEAGAKGADAGLKSGAWNTKKVTAHHAIIPTGETPVNLTEREKQLYGMIALGYILQFYPALRYEAQKISVTIKDTQWEARGRCILEPGWTACGEEEDEERKEKDQALPAVRNGDAVNCMDVALLKKKTTPPPRFTEGSLIEAMANVHRFVNDAKAKATLRENEGIGTEATRAGILETLKARKYLKPEGKALVSTALAGQVIDLTPPLLRDPVTTAQWESRLEAIARGENTLEAFMADQIRIVPELVAGILATDVKGLTGSGPMHPCPECGKALRRRQGKDGNGDWWGCTGYPECRVTLPDDHGKPGKREARTASEFPCPVCGKPLYPGKNDRGPFWSCYNKAGHADGNPVFLPDDGGKPGAPKEKTPRTQTEFLCPTCGKPLELHHDISKKSGRPYDWYGCSGYPACRERFFAKDGKPEFGGK